MQRVARQRGFTLVEVLIVLVLTSLITLTLFSAFRSGVKAWRTAELHIQQVEGARQLINVVRRHLMQAVPVSLVYPDRTEFAFNGTPTSLRYVAPLAMSAGGALNVVELFSHAGRPGVWGSFRPYVEAGEDVGADEDEASLISKNVSVSFEYYDPTDQFSKETS